MAFAASLFSRPLAKLASNSLLQEVNKITKDTRPLKYTNADIVTQGLKIQGLKGTSGRLQGPFIIFLKVFLMVCPIWLPLFSPIFLSNCIAAIFHPVYGAGIRTHDFLIVSLIALTTRTGYYPPYILFSFLCFFKKLSAGVQGSLPSLLCIYMSAKLLFDFY